MYEPDPNKPQDRAASPRMQDRPASPAMMVRTRPRSTGTMIVGLIVVLAVIFVGYMLIASTNKNPPAPPLSDQSVVVPAPATPTVSPEPQPPTTTPAPDQSMSPSAPGATDQAPMAPTPAEPAPTPAQ